MFFDVYQENKGIYIDKYNKTGFIRHSMCQKLMLKFAQH